MFILRMRLFFCRVWWNETYLDNLQRLYVSIVKAGSISLELGIKGNGRPKTQEVEQPRKSRSVM